MTSFVEDPAIVAGERFILATRDTGYRSVTAAVAELVDNALQANARRIHIAIRDVSDAGGRSVTLSVLDDGHGMEPKTLQAALQFGGSSRFGERTGLGRFGMGLPNSSVSQTRRVDVYSWQLDGPILFTYLDVDEVASGELRSIPMPRERVLPAWVLRHSSRTGTLVEWTRCDRLSRLRASTIANRLRNAFGRLYRFALWEGVRLTVNEVRIDPIDPLFLHTQTALRGGVPFGPPLRYEFAVANGGSAAVEVRFSELPVRTWHAWGVEVKRRFGIVGRAGVSVVRAGREIDYGWYLMGTKRRENYDDWWRCEIRFSPQLDEFFGVTHSKQGVTPSQSLRAAIEPDLEAIARTLNRRVRIAFERAKGVPPSRAARIATTTDTVLPVPPTQTRSARGPGLKYRIEIGTISTPEFFRTEVVKGTVLVTLNREHPFIAAAYLPIATSDSRERYNLECMLIAAARADLEATSPAERKFLARVRRSWADALAAFAET